MKKVKITLTAWLTICFSSIYCQTILKGKYELDGYNQVHQEKIFIHHNTSLLITGENLYYSVFCLNEKTNSFSSLSKMAYVELIGENGARIFRHKIRLVSGLGQGDFFVPTDVPSGNYKLLGYTRWMINKGKDSFFQNDITIINPYQVNQKSLFAKNDITEIDTLNNFKADATPVFPMKSKSDIKLKLVLNKKVFDHRERVRLLLQGVKEITPYGNYSLSVRRVDKIHEPSRKNASIIFLKSGKKENTLIKSIGDSVYLPELRGELIFGKVLSKSKEASIKNVKVSLSVPGKDFIVKVSSTDDEGRFYFNLNKNNQNTDAYIQILEQEKGLYKVLMEESIVLDYRNLEFDKFEITSAITDLVLERSIHNQIENAYAETRSDSIALFDSNTDFYHNFNQTYYLDDYTRFPTIRETLLEIVDNVWTEKRENGEYVFQTRGLDYIIGSEFQAMALIDGVLIKNQNDFMNIDAKKIEKISVMRNKFILGPQIYQGIISFESFDSDIVNSIKDEYETSAKLLRPLPRKKYFVQRYDDETQKMTNHIPDYRHQLLWIPNIKLETMQKSIGFFTSDVSGNYEISLEGFTFSGEPVSIRKTFMVKNN